MKREKKVILELLKAMTEEKAIADCYCEHPYMSNEAFLKVLFVDPANLPSGAKILTVEETAEMLFEAMDNIPDYAYLDAISLVLPNQLGSTHQLKVTIKVKIGPGYKDGLPREEFHAVAHNAFGSRMGFIS